MGTDDLFKKRRAAKKTRTKSSESDPETEVYKLIEQLKSYLE